MRRYLRAFSLCVNSPSVLRSIAILIFTLFVTDLFAQQLKCANTDQTQALPRLMSPDQVLPGDFNNDGFNDVIITPTLNIQDKTVLVYYGSATGLQLESTWDFPHLESATVPGDINNDGYDDIILTVTDTAFFYMGSASGPMLNPEMTIFLRDLAPVASETAIGRVFKTGDLNSDNIEDFIILLFQASQQPGGTVLMTFHGTTDAPVLVDEATEAELGIQSGVEDIFAAGDVNGDGRGDIGVFESNRQYLFYGTDQGFTASASFSVQHNTFLSTSWSALGDVNGDGYDDMLITQAIERAKEPIVFLYLGSAAGLTQPANWRPKVRFVPEEEHLNYGFYSGPVGDVNQDGYDDFFIYGGDENYSRIFYGSASLPDSAGNIKMPRNAYQLVNAGDIDGNGENDLLSYIPSNQVTSIQTYYGASAGLMSEVTCPTSDEQADRVFPGQQAKSAGDVNGDGAEDLVVGYNDFLGNEDFDSGQLSVYFGGPGPKPSPMSYSIQGHEFGNVFGSGDFNGDGFSDVVAGDEYYDGPFGQLGRIFIFYGSASGMDNVPDWTLVGNEQTRGIGFGLQTPGDINGDRYDDLVFPTESAGVKLYYGSPSGPVESGVALNGFGAAGDVNGDGFPDAFQTDQNAYRLYWGSASGLVPSEYTINITPYYAGDVNNDGFDDMFTYDNNSQTLTLYFGNATGFNPANSTITGGSTPNWIGDINGDGFDDLAVRRSTDTLIFESALTHVDIHLGSATGYSQEVYKSIKGDELFQRAETLSRIGDVNNDGIDDIGVNIYYQVWVIYGERDGSQPTPCDTDATPPTITCVPAQTFCKSTSGSYMLPKLTATDNCKVQSISYVISGATKRSGNGDDASGKFNVGQSTITWTVMDSIGNKSTCTTIVNVIGSFTARITKAYQVNAEQSAANTIYLGYANNTLRLSVYVGSNNTGYKYKWSTGDTTRFTRVRHNMPGKYEHWVAVTNPNGCVDTARTIVTVIDNYCPNALKDFITQYFPDLLKETWVQALIMATSTSYVCYNGTTTCVPTGSLKEAINNGAKLGKCAPMMKLQSEEVITSAKRSASEKLNASVSPNPSSGEFNITVEGTKGLPYSLRIVNSTGITMEVKQNITQTFIKAGASFGKGVYYAEIRQGNETKVVRLLKIR